MFKIRSFRTRQVDLDLRMASGEATVKLVSTVKEVETVVRAKLACGSNKIIIERLE